MRHPTHHEAGAPEDTAARAEALRLKKAYGADALGLARQRMASAASDASDELFWEQVCAFLA